jgi:hypothetical protein
MMTYYYYALTSSIAGKGFLKLKKNFHRGHARPVCVLACADLFSGLPPPPPFSFFLHPKTNKNIESFENVSSAHELIEKTIHLRQCNHF